MRCGASQKKSPRDSTQSTALGGLSFWDVSQIAAYREKLISCQKGLDVAAIKRLPQMGHTWRISHLGQ